MSLIVVKQQIQIVCLFVFLIAVTLPIEEFSRANSVASLPRIAMYWLYVLPAFYTLSLFSRFFGNVFITQQTANFLEFVKRNRTLLFSH